MIRECQLAAPRFGGCAMQMGHDQPASLAHYLDWAGEDGALTDLPRSIRSPIGPRNAEGAPLRGAATTTTTYSLVQVRSPGANQVRS
jgi:hypothetical protein